VKIFTTIDIYDAMVFKTGLAISTYVAIHEYPHSLQMIIGPKSSLRTISISIERQTKHDGKSTLDGMALPFSYRHFWGSKIMVTYICWIVVIWGLRECELFEKVW
jgi:hypothetical protein